MPLPWFSLPPEAVHALQNPPAQTQRFGDLVVEAPKATFEEGRVVFSQGVRAMYGAELLTADTLILYPGEQRGEAEGNVVLVDPDGTLRAQNLSFVWREGAKGGQARNVRLEAGGLELDAASFETRPGEPPTFVFTDVKGTTCGGERNPAFHISSPRVEITPGDEAVVRRPSIYLFGRKIVTLPTRKINLDPRVQGVGLPSLAYSQDEGVGVRWDVGLLINEQTAFSFDGRVFGEDLPSIKAYVTRSFLDPQRTDSLIVPSSELEERFRGGYFDNVQVSSPTSEASRLHKRRETLSLGTVWNAGSPNDDEDDSLYSKPLELVYERGGDLGQFGYQASARLQAIRREDDAQRTRAVLTGTVASPVTPIGPHLDAYLRLDAAAFAGSTTYSWLRSETGLIYSPAEWLRLGGALVKGVDAGDPMYAIDTLFSSSAIHWRADVALGPRTLSYLLKQDLDNDDLFTEYSASQALGCFEAFITYRERPRSYQIGLRLRPIEFFERLRQRNVQRSTSSESPPMSH